MFGRLSTQDGFSGLSVSVKPQETSVLQKGLKTLVRGQEGLPHPHRYKTRQKHQYQHPYQHHITQSFCPQDREGGINGGWNFYLSKSFSTLLLIFSFRNITQLIITPYSNTNVFGSWGNITTLLGAHQWHSVGIG